MAWFKGPASRIVGLLGRPKKKRRFTVKRRQGRDTAQAEIGLRGPPFVRVLCDGFSFATSSEEPGRKFVSIFEDDLLRERVFVKAFLVQLKTLDQIRH